MLPNLRAYHRPTSLEEAVQRIRPPAVVPLAGGTVLLPSRDPAVEEVVDLSGLGLTYIQVGEDGIHIGATTSLQHLLESPPLAEWTADCIGTVVRLTASRNLRGQATIGGMVMAGGPENPLLVFLLALDAGLTLYGPTPIRLSLDEFLNRRDEFRHRGVLITELVVPYPGALWGMGFAHVGRTPRDRPIVCAAAFLQQDGGLCRTARLVLGGVAERPLRAREAEAFLRNRPLKPEEFRAAARIAASPLRPPGDFRGSGEYRRAMAEVLARRALEHARRNTK
ncbi:MAG: FAD binding domain-containing protein [Anaerolineae bacterium]|nr:FAD binding domain-containing protein [Anaerolineae bacterium]MDW8067372.1 FAD binding domain-containing protein [Anaerolineae bacterium]